MSGLPSLLASSCTDSPFGASSLLDYADLVRVVRVPTESAGHPDAALVALYGGDAGAAADVYDRPKSLMESAAGDEGEAANALVYLPGGIAQLGEDPKGALLIWVRDGHGHALDRSGTIIGVRSDDALLVHVRA